MCLFKIIQIERITPGNLRKAANCFHGGNTMKIKSRLLILFCFVFLSLWLGAGSSAGLAAEPGPGSQPEQNLDRFVTIDFEAVDINLFIKYISELTGKNFIIDKAVRGNVTIVSPTKISVDEAYKVFESVLEVQGFTTVPAGPITKIVPSADARSKSVATGFRKDTGEITDQIVTQLIPLKYADPEELKKLFTPLVSKNSVVISYPATNLLIVTDVLSNINRLLQIIKEIDVEENVSEIDVIPLYNATATEVAQTLDTIFEGSTTSTKSTPAPRHRVSMEISGADCCIPSKAVPGWG